MFQTHKTLYFVLALIAVLGVGGFVIYRINDFKIEEEIAVTILPSLDEGRVPNLPSEALAKGGGQERLLADDIAGWKTYRNGEYGFEMKYPSFWNVFPANHSGVLYDHNKKKIGEDIGVAYFVNKGWVLTVDKSHYIDEINKLSIKKIAENEITLNNCPGNENQTGDHYIGDFNKGSIYVLYCSASSESYYYLVRNPLGDLIKFTYSDDWGSSEPEANIVQKFKAILSTIRFLE